MIDQNGDNKRTGVGLTNTTMVQHYRIIEKIGSGGMGEVYLAEDTKLKRKVALKFLPVDQTRNTAVLQQFTQEARAAARLQHPNIITVHEVNEHESVPYISMAYIDGQSLKELSEEKSISVQNIIDMGIQITSGLAAAHEKGITHRDLKPSNLIIDRTGTVKILDFGLAILSDVQVKQDPSGTLTSDPFANKIAGTISYMAPEQLLGQEVSPLVDVFAFGIIMYELIAAQHPFAAQTAQEIAVGILRDTPADLSLKRSHVPYDLSRIVSRCLNKKPDKRFQTARDVCNELEELSNDLKQEVAITVTEKGQTRQGSILSEESFILTTDLVRRLSHKDPKMIGRSLAFIDNGVTSDKLVFLLHGMGNDHRQFSDTLRQLPFRAIAFSLFGFDYNAKVRVPATLDDHSILMHALFKDVCDRLRPRQVVLIGFSSGADHVLHFISSGKFDDLKVTGLLSLGSNIHLNDCFATSKLSLLSSGDENQILSTIKEFSNNSSSLSDWLLLHGYLLTAFSKFGTQTEPLRQYSNDIIAPFRDGGWTQFSKWYKSCASKVPHMRFVFDSDGYNSLDRILKQHLEDNVLGDDFHEDTIVRDPISHMELGQTEMVCKHILAFMKHINEK